MHWPKVQRTMEYSYWRSIGLIAQSSLKSCASRSHELPIVCLPLYFAIPIKQFAVHVLYLALGYEDCIQGSRTLTIIFVRREVCSCCFLRSNYVLCVCSFLFLNLCFFVSWRNESQRKATNITSCTSRYRVNNLKTVRIEARSFLRFQRTNRFFAQRESKQAWDPQSISVFRSRKPSAGAGRWGMMGRAKERSLFSLATLAYC